MCFIISCRPALPLNLRHPGSPVTFGSIDDAVAPISSSPAAAPAVKPADVVKFFGSVAVQNGGSDAASPPPSTQSPVPKIDQKSIARLFQGPSRLAYNFPPEGVFDISGETRKKEEDEGHRWKEEKRDREEQEKPAVPPVRLPQVRRPVRCASVSITP